MNRIEKLESEIRALTRICSELDPYRPIPTMLQKELWDLGIKDQTDPFKITNKLLLSMENAIEELHGLRSKKQLVQ